MEKGTGSKVPKRKTSRTDTCNLSEQQAIELSSSTCDALISKGILTTNKFGYITNSFNNYLNVLLFDPYLQGKLYFNELTYYPEVEGVYWNTNRHALEDMDFRYIRAFISIVYDISGESSVSEAIYTTCYRQRYHPVRMELENLKWDGTERIGLLFPRYLGAERSDYTTAATRIFLNGAIMRIMKPGIKFDTCLVFQSDDQGIGKSTMSRFIALRDDWFTDTKIDFGKSKEAGEIIRGKTVVELGEMLAIKAAKEIETVKSFLSRNTDRFREAFGKAARDYNRQCVFIGTANPKTFLPNDPTGNRRFLPILCRKDRQEVHPLADEGATRDYIRQCFAEAMATIDMERPQLILPHCYDEEADRLREESMPEDFRTGRIKEWLNNAGEDRVCIPMLCEKALEMEDLNRDAPPRVQNTIREIMDKVPGWHRCESKQRCGKYGVVRCWERDEQAEFEPISEGDKLPFS